MGKQYKALVVDDDDDSRDLLDVFLRSRGFLTVTATNGKDALGKLGMFMPNIVLTDIAMPVMDGWNFLERKWADASVARIPVIVVSASTEILKRAHPFEVMPKPVDLEKLAEKVSSMLRAA